MRQYHNGTEQVYYEIYQFSTYVDAVWTLEEVDRVLNTLSQNDPEDITVVRKSRAEMIWVE